MKQKGFSIIFQGLSIMETTQNLLEGESLTLRTSLYFKGVFLYFTLQVI